MSDGFFVADLAAGVAAGDRVIVTDQEAFHASVVRRLTLGEQVTVTDGMGRGIQGRVVTSTRNQVEVEVTSVLPNHRISWWVTVAQAIPKAGRGELAVDLMTEVGVDEILPWGAARSQVKWAGEQGAKAHAKWVATAREASKQARRLRFPVVAEYAGLAGVARAITDADYAIIMHEKASRPITDCLVPRSGRVVIVIGPEGGLTDEEVSVLEQAGGRPFLMGSTVLRTSTAGAVAITQVRLLSELNRVTRDGTR